MFRVLALSESTFGGCARACVAALRRLGCDVLEVNHERFLPQARRWSVKVSIKLLRPWLVHDYNEWVIAEARAFKPHFTLVFKGQFVGPRTLQALRRLGAALYNFYPDTSAFAHRPYLAESLPEYDCLFYTKRFWDADVRSRITVRQSRFLQHGYDPELHHSWDLDPEDAADFNHDVSFMGIWMPHKQEVLINLIRAIPDIDLTIRGSYWGDRCAGTALSKFVVGGPLIGVRYAKAICAARINLSIMSGIVPGASRGDETTMRTYEIPACGGFMLHERSEELQELFEDGKEVVTFDSTAELARKIQYYLAHPAERAAVARAGQARCVPAYSYDRRMRYIVEWHGAKRVPAKNIADSGAPVDLCCA